MAREVRVAGKHLDRQSGPQSSRSRFLLEQVDASGRSMRHVQLSARTYAAGKVPYSIVQYSMVVSRSGTGIVSVSKPASWVRSASSMRNEKERRRHLVCASLKAYVRTSCSESLCDTHTLTVHTVIILRLMEAGTCAAMAAAFDFV